MSLIRADFGPDSSPDFGPVSSSAIVGMCQRRCPSREYEGLADEDGLGGEDRGFLFHRHASPPGEGRHLANHAYEDPTWLLVAVG
jgi:hypothetical protein